MSDKRQAAAETSITPRVLETWDPLVFLPSPIVRSKEQATEGILIKTVPTSENLSITTQRICYFFYF